MAPETPTRVAVVGGGSWGTALAHLLASLGHRVVVWAYEAEVAEAIRERHENPVYLAGIPLDPRLTATTDLGEAVAGAEVLLSVVPTPYLRPVLRRLQGLLAGAAPPPYLVSATKGIENDTLMMVSQILAEELPAIPASRCAYLSGPSFAREVAQGLPTAVTLASESEATAKHLQALLTAPSLRVYTSPDVVGVELGGAVKNVIAIATGACTGLGLGSNTIAALITRGEAEVAALGTAMGAHPLTFLGLAGIGDLVLTCTGELSRNRTVGLRLGRGESLRAILKEMRMVAEGVRTTRSVYHLAKRLGVAMPICSEVYHVLYEGADLRGAVDRLMERELKEEWEDLTGIGGPTWSRP
ncbi:MAG: NAD(P)-dependent glycerol-3-phosphate dehydrogenase [Nitrospirae bacterium]|nr:MAG: NAD(P)-dependent glycerol-3-phosphate dehydrogenase [Nitrospirota bacterium]